MVFRLGRKASSCRDGKSTLNPEKKQKVQGPMTEIQYDNVDHMPQIDDKKEATRCKLPLCKGRTHFYCNKCRDHLCLAKKRNCFERFHRK
ncbi:hypothetical protein ANTQUA_LOCUS4062 [Anthophora quadrimaculata]